MEIKHGTDSLRPAKKWYEKGRNIALVCSLALNGMLAIALLWVVFSFVVQPLLEGEPETFDGKMGVLTEDIDVGPFGSPEVLFRLPRGLHVRDASAFGMDWFEEHRFRIVVTTDRPNLVDYSDGQREEKKTEFYSADRRDTVGDTDQSSK